ncbi:hypothetical protein [Aeromicrobium sp. Leaf291]|uniref:hypothetical protein n=1 Tax=Aeromicrobium sp. Leaf291 TaxID=1736325 RepID=UPI0006FA9F7B|nr:hypothetical protein [Aeromicrobium sp. Leaf291]KQP81621.1 hypothetical protein ASF35_16450 [Aeromicrobium sp. Leaf291]
MTLHGTVQVNGHTVGAWDAVRVAQLPSGVCRYRCEVWPGIPWPGVGDAGVVRGAFEVEHDPADGAVALAARVLAAAAQLAPDPPRGT